MDKILEFINSKTSNKYQNLLLFDAIYNTQTNTMQITFKKTSNCLISQENTSELQVLCKQFLGDLVNEVKVEFKNEAYTITEFKDFVKTTISNHQNFISINVNELTFDFEKDNVNVFVPHNKDLVNINDLNSIKQELEKFIFEQTNIDVRFVFNDTKNENIDVLQLRKDRILEDNKIYEQIKNSQTVNFDIVQNIYNKLTGTNGIIAGGDIGTGNVVVVGKIKNITEKFVRAKTDDDVSKDTQKKYLSIELENEGLVTRCVLFIKQGLDVPVINIGESVAVEGTVSEFRGSKDIRVKNMAICQYEPPQQVWRSKPTTYRYVKPEPYEFFEQSNFFMIQQDTNCEYLKNNTFVVYDLETTGISADTNDIIDIGAFKIVNGKIVEKFATFVNPLREIPEEASKINHITNSMVENSPTIEQVLPDFYNFCYGATIVGYNNIGFDDLFIKKEGKKQLYNFDNKRDDVMQIAKTYIKGLKNYKLGTVCAEMGIQLIDAHRATNDALATAKLFIKLAEKFL